MWRQPAAQRAVAQGALLLCLLLPSHSVQTSSTSPGEVCDPHRSHCGQGLGCSCLALNRGLWVCQPPGFLDPPAYAAKYERQGLSCEARLPSGAKPIPAPPLFASQGVLDPRQGPEELRQWSAGPARNFYSQYVLVAHPQDQLLGIPVLAGPDVSPESIKTTAATIHHLLLEAAVSNHTLASLAHAGVRFLIAAQEVEGTDAWLSHPEVGHSFTTGLGGGSPLFPSTGIHEGEDQASVVEELFHTIQYCALSPREVCMYRKAYQNAMKLKLYTTDHSGHEVDGEPVPTVQADEYLAMALHRWFGSPNGAEDEYRVMGNSKRGTGRASLRKADPKAFCLLSTLSRADDTWDFQGEPWTSSSNQGNKDMDTSEVSTFCAPVLHELAAGCPSHTVEWPTVRPRIIP